VTPNIRDGGVLLHIGPQKTGSTAIQYALFAARGALARHGVHYVGTRPVEKEAGWVALGIGSSIGRRTPRPEAWRRVVDEIAAAAPGRICFSNEEFGRADDAAVNRILDATGAERTHLVYVARRLDKVLPSHWQQQVRARMTAFYPDFLREVLAPGSDTWATRLVMAPQDVGAVLERWGRLLPPERMTVIIADESDRNALPRTFESLLELPTGLLIPPELPANRSMGFAETETLRRLNRVTREEGWTPSEYRHLVQLGAVKALKARPSAPRTRITGVPDWAFDRVADLADAQVEAIMRSGAQVVGDPEQLRVREHGRPVPVPAELESVDIDLLVDLVGGMRAGHIRLLTRELQAAKRGAERESRARLESLDGRQLLQLLVRHTAARFGLRRS
jgi:hypothetical protein